MGRKAIITQEQVNDIAEKLVSMGSAPTVRSVRASLGAGSMATVGKYVNVWRSRHTSLTEKQESALPATLQKSLLDFVASEVTKAKADVDRALLMAREENNDLIAEAAHQSLTMTELTEEQAHWRARTTELEVRLSLSTESRIAAEKMNDALRQDLSNARIEIARQQVRLEVVPQLETEIAQLQEALRLERQCKVAADTALAVALAQLEKQGDKKRQSPRKSRVTEIQQP
jgi:hypothetical protein